MKKEKIFVDMDGVIADIFTDWVSYYNKIYNDNISVEDITEWDLREVVKEEAKETIFNIFEIKGFYRNLNVICNSQKVLKELNKKHEIYILTDPFVKNSLLEKWEWIEEHFPFIDTRNIIFSGDKSIVGSKEDWLIDDKVENIIDFKGKGLLFTAPHNKTNQDLRRVNSWKKIYEIFQ